MAGPEKQAPVPWDEAREVLAVVLLVAAVLNVTGPLVRFVAIESQFSFWDDLRIILNNVSITTGTLLLAAALVICTTPTVDTVPLLRRAVSLVATVVAALGALAAVNVLTAATGDDSVYLRISAVMVRSGPATLLAATAAWLVDRVRFQPLEEP